MRFQFDPGKAKANRAKHGVPFSDAEGVFNDPLASEILDRRFTDEDRFIRIGEGSAGKI